MRRKGFGFDGLGKIIADDYAWYNTKGKNLFKNINVFTKYRMQSYQNMEIIIIFAALNSKK
ncbi:hypothetical protein OH816_09080 [Chryseobacterium sp. CFS7]|uniref:hypothetical protein n=1 Tax=Chryseobacterium sp. CFS7 TaxID=2986941 RepID=UPI0028530BF5|nr:hypothetical protein [Chryseobacterium sp. CFS7]MDR4892304.1 hypothetical protein [Chryseobacterium sp. CFS7]